MFVEGQVTEEELKKLKEGGYDIIFEARNLNDAQDLGLFVDYESKDAQKIFWDDFSENSDVWVKIYVDTDVYEYF